MTDNNSTPNGAATGFLGFGPLFWGVLFVVAMFGVAAFAAFALDGAVRLLVMVLPMVLLFPFIRATENRHAAQGNASPVMMRYNRRMLLASFGYVIGLGIAIPFYDRFTPNPGAAFAAAMLPALPTLMMIWAMARYLIEEQDEYLRYRTIMAALMSLGLVLTLGILWGFLETFGIVPHIWAWWVLPVWAIGFGVSQLVMKVRGA